MLTNIELAKAKLALHAPEFISLTSKLEFVPTPGLGTAGTDGRHLFYDPVWIDSLTLPQTVGLVLHEVMHNMLAHPARIGNRDKRIGNVAMDIVGNQMLQQYFDENKNLKAEFPPGGLYGPQFDKYAGWNWEKVYADLVENADKTPQFDNVSQAVNEDGSQATQAEAESLAKEWTMAAQAAANMAKQRGQQSAFFESFVSGLVKTKVDWRSQVLDEFTKVAKDDQSYRRFNRKFMHDEMYLPGMYSERIGLVVFATDTSGSMSDENFKLGLGGMNEIMQDLKPDKIVHICCDTEVKSVEELTPDDLPIVAGKFKGRGGTELRGIFEHVKAMDELPELVVCLSDGEFGVIPADLEPRCPVVWLLTTGSLDAARQSFGRIVQVGLEG